jgi:putative tryptophan/tyrosine transport system substrate-binding protein
MHLTRRGFSRIAASACLGSLASFPLAARGQSAAKVYRVGILGNQDNPPWEGLRQGLQALGYFEGRNITIDWRWSQGFPDRLPALARELVALKPDVLVISGSQAALAAKAATGTLPIVAALTQHPEQLGLVSSLARPGSNVTGLSTYSPQLSAKKLELLKEVVPNIYRVALIWNPASESERLQFRDVMGAAATAGVTIQSIEVQTPGELPRAFSEIRSSRAQALMAIGNPINFKGREQLAEFALKHRLPSIFEEGLFVEAGGLMSYGPSFIEMFRRAATYVDKILKGAKPADLPIEQPTGFELIINWKTATALGLAIPPAVLLRADKVIR